jgi:LemA protein
MVALEIVLGFGVLLVAGVALFYIVSIINGLITLKNSIEKAWSNIDVLLKQRNDEIPNVVETVKGYAKHEKEVFENVTKMRAQMMSAGTVGEKAKASEALSGTLKTLFAVAENYPSLRANENFLQLQGRISELEGQIANRRELYNDSVYLYNTRIQVVPDMVFANAMGMREKEYFKVEEAEKKVPKVQF